MVGRQHGVIRQANIEIESTTQQYHEDLVNVHSGLLVKPYDNHATLGFCCLKYDEMAFTNIGKVALERCRQVCFTDRIRSTHRLPFSL